MSATLPAAQLGHDVYRHAAWGCVLLCLDARGVAALASQCDCKGCGDGGIPSLLRAYGVDPARAELRWYDDGSLLAVATRPSGRVS